MESLLSGTSSEESEVPEQWIDFQVMKAMGWSFQQLMDTPPYVRGMVTDFLSLESEAVANRTSS